MALIPVVTIITPVYNGEKFLAETIDSVINASISIPYEFLVLNDGSLDSTMEILEENDDLYQKAVCKYRG